MSKYTVEVRFLCETYAGYSESQGFKKVNEIIEKAIPYIFEEFPIFDESYRNVLETKILKHYYNQEIGAETPGLWQLWLNTRLNEIMPYYNQLYKSALLEFNPFYDVDYTTDYTKEGRDTKEENFNETKENNLTSNSSTETASGTHDTTSSNANAEDSTDTQRASMDKFSNTPQGTLIEEDLLTKYLTEARGITDTTSSHDLSTSKQDVKSDTTSNADSKTNTTQESGQILKHDLNHTIDTLDKYLEHVKGKRGGQSYSQLLTEFRDTFLNIDLQIIEELQDLFMGLW